MTHLSLFELWRREFTGYNLDTFRQDLLAGVTVGAVALPLALAFGVASGATAAAGLVTAILAGLIIGLLSGAPYQISGPTGAMSAILILLSQQYGLTGVWVAGVISGIIILLIGLFRLGRFIAYIPAPVITGFTSGIAVIIFTGQIDNLLGSKNSVEPFVELLKNSYGITLPTTIAESSLVKLFNYLRFDFSLHWPTLLIGLLVIAIMIFWPSKLNKYVPGSLAGIIVATIVTLAPGFDGAKIIGEIPRTILLADRLRFADIPWESLGSLIVPIVSISALGAIESLLCGAVASKSTGIRLQANTELIAQGIGNIIIPFFGGVPATAAIARTSVGIRSGGKTRLVSILHALVLLLSALLLAPIIGRIPLAALAGVLMVTSFRMNEWHAIRYMFRNRFKTGIFTFFATLLATVSLDLTQAIIIGAAISAAIFINQVANLQIDVQKVDAEKMRKRGMNLKTACKGVKVAYLTGPLFFAATSQFNEAFTQPDEHLHTLILSMRAVPLIDLSGLEALTTLHEDLHKQGKTLMISGLQPTVKRMMERANLDKIIGETNLFWSADRAIMEAEQRHLKKTGHKDGKGEPKESAPQWNGSTALALWTPAEAPQKGKAVKKKH